MFEANTELMATMGLAVVAMRGHHRRVATPEPVSALAA